jgi:hypothetical protein
MQPSSHSKLLAVVVEVGDAAGISLGGNSSPLTSISVHCGRSPSSSSSFSSQWTGITEVLDEDDAAVADRSSSWCWTSSSMIETAFSSATKDLLCGRDPQKARTTSCQGQGHWCGIWNATFDDKRRSPEDEINHGGRENGRKEASRGGNGT